MSERDDGGRAFPQPYAGILNGEHNWAEQFGVGGMSLRDYFRAHAPELPLGLEPEPSLIHEVGAGGFNAIADMYGKLERAWRDAYADTMLAEDKAHAAGGSDG